MTTEKIHVAFHVGRGGRFYNAGHKTFIGEMKFSDLVQKRSEYLFEKNRDEKGRFCSSYLTNGNGSFVTDDSINDFTGRLDFDGDYDTDIVKEINDCTESEIDIISNSMGFKSYDLINCLEA